MFVTHEGSEEVHVGAASSWRDVLRAFGGEVQKRVKTAWTDGLGLARIQHEHARRRGDGHGAYDGG